VIPLPGLGVAESVTGSTLVGSFADTDVTRYEIENNENMINTNDKRVILFINPP
jgi:hypothetical protein